MSDSKTTLSPTAVDLINNISGVYSAPFWDGIQEVTGILDTVRKIKAVLETLCSTGSELEAYNLILAVYDLIAVETPSALSRTLPGRNQAVYDSLFA